jgi:hypothetical protein
MNRARLTAQPSHTGCIRGGRADRHAGSVAKGLTIGRLDARTFMRWLDEPQATCSRQIHNKEDPPTNFTLNLSRPDFGPGLKPLGGS